MAEVIEKHSLDMKLGRWGHQVKMDIHSFIRLTTSTKPLIDTYPSLKWGQDHALYNIYIVSNQMYTCDSNSPESTWSSPTVYR